MWGSNEERKKRDRDSDVMIFLFEFIFFFYTALQCDETLRKEMKETENVML